MYQKDSVALLGAVTVCDNGAGSTRDVAARIGPYWAVLNQLVGARVFIMHVIDVEYDARDADLTRRERFREAPLSAWMAWRVRERRGSANPGESQDDPE